MFSKNEENEKENILSEQVASDQIDKFLKYYDLSIRDLKGKQEKELFETCKEKCIRALMDGRLTIKDESGFPKITQKLKSGSLLEYNELAGKHKTAMKDCDDGDMYGRIYALVGAITGVGGEFIEETKGSDMSLIESLGFLFLKV